MNVTDDRPTADGRTTTYSEHEHEFTFAKMSVRKIAASTEEGSGRRMGRKGTGKGKC